MWKNNVKLLSLAVFAALSLTVVSCGTKKNLVDATTSATKAAGGAKSAESRNLDFMRKVYDNEVYAKSISSKIKFTIATGSKDLSVSGSLRMKKDEVIRIQITPFGLMEAARIEFTKDYVLFMDRINKEYVKASYADVDFLKANGLGFYALQALFWNQLFVPGTQKITDSSLKKFSVTPSGAAANTVVSLKHGDLDYRWTADKANGRIKAVGVTYRGKSSGTTTVTCDYGAFKPLGAKQFPTDITLKVQSDAVKAGNGKSLNISISDIDTAGDWETYTTVSGKYRQVDAADLVGKLLKL